jgi:ribose/xylose/arabinose/galactoside ABC-type transport system permease subunit
MVTVILFLVFTITQPRFATSINLQNMLTAVAVLWVVSIGMTFVILNAGADLSVGATAALAGIFFAKIIGVGVPDVLAVLLTLAFGAAVGGLVNGLPVGRLGMSFFVVTLASMIGLTGAVNLWTGTESFPVDSSLPAAVGIDKYAGVPGPIWIMGLTLVLGLYIQRWTYFGRDVYAVGGSLNAARLSGIRTTRTIVYVYALSALCATIGTIITIGRIGVAAPTVDIDLPLLAIAAVLLGGSSLTGGVGGVGGTAIGVLFIGILQNGLSIAGVPSFWQQVVTGVILFLAVLIDQVDFKALRARRRDAAPTAPASPPMAA